MLGGLGRAENANEEGELDNGDLNNDNENVSKKKKVITS